MVRHHRESVVFTLVVTLLAFLGAGLMALVIALSGAPDTLLLASVLAFLPVGPLVAQLTGVHRFELGHRLTLQADPRHLYVFDVDERLAAAPADWD